MELRLLGLSTFLFLLSSCSHLPVSRVPVSLPETEIINQEYLQTKSDHHFIAGELLSLEGKSEEAIEEFKSVLVYDTKSTKPRYRLAVEYVKVGNNVEAIRLCENIIAENPSDVETRNLLGGVFSANQSFKEAELQYQAILKIDPKNTEALVMLGALAAEQKHLDHAVEVFQKVIKLDEAPSSGLAAFYAGRIRQLQFEQSKRKNESFKTQAVKYFEKSLLLKPNHSDAALNLARIYELEKKPKKVIQVLEDFVKSQGPQGQISEILAQKYLEEKMPEKAIEHLQYVEQLSEDPLPAKLKLASIWIDEKNYSQAISKLQEILVAVPESDKVNFYLAAILEEIEKPSESVGHFLKIEKESPYFVEARIHAVYLYKKLNQFDKALVTIEDAISKSDMTPEFYSLYAGLLDEGQQTDQAITVLKNALKKMPTSNQLKFILGTLYDKKDQKTEVVKIMSDVIKDDPQHVQALNYLAFTFAETGKNLDLAEELARRAVKLAPEDGFILDTLGWVLFKRGKFKASASYLELALQKEPEEGVISFHLGEAYFQLNKIAQSKQAFDRALKLETNESKKSEIASRVEKLFSSQANRAPASEP